MILRIIAAENIEEGAGTVHFKSRCNTIYIQSVTVCAFKQSQSGTVYIQAMD